MLVLEVGGEQGALVFNKLDAKLTSKLGEVTALFALQSRTQ